MRFEGRLFRYGSPDGVLDHLLGSGAQEVFYDALEPGSRRNMEERFKVELAKRARKGAYNVIHDYIMCVAQTEKEARKIP